MDKTFTISDIEWPTLRCNDILLQINKEDIGLIKIVDLELSGFYLQLQILDNNWIHLPTLAADLYKHLAGPIGYATLQSATQAIAAILTAHGWVDVTKKEKDDTHHKQNP